MNRREWLKQESEVVTSPEGAKGVSPARKRWVEWEPTASPEGTARFLNSFGPSLSASRRVLASGRLAVTSPKTIRMSTNPTVSKVGCGGARLDRLRKKPQMLALPWNSGPFRAA